MRQNRHDGPRGAWYIPLDTRSWPEPGSLFSDAALRALVPDPFLASRLQTLKGWGFVLCTALLLAVLLHREYGRLRRHQVEILPPEPPVHGAHPHQPPHRARGRPDRPVLRSLPGGRGGRPVPPGLDRRVRRTDRPHPADHGCRGGALGPARGGGDPWRTGGRAAAIRQTQTWHDLAGDQIRFDWRAAAREAAVAPWPQCPS
jgi:hypothetical protein